MEDVCDFQGDIEVIQKMEDEHLRLQRQFRVIQRDRLDRTMGVHPQFRRQDHLLNTLKREYIDLNKDLKIARSGTHKKYENKIKKDLYESLFLYEHAEDDVEGGLAIMEELDGLFQRDKREMVKLRKLAIASRGEVPILFKEDEQDALPMLDCRRSKSENRLMSAENKLETAMLRFNAVQNENKIIREQIEHMLKDRMLFKQAWDKMLTSLGKGKKFLSDLFESSTLAYDKRDEWCTKLRSVQEKGRMEQLMQVQEMRDLKNVYDHEMKTYNFLAKKGVMRVNRRQEEKEIEQKRKTEEEIKKEFDKHIKILDDIQDYTEEQSYKKIIDSFVKREFSNFSLYKLLTDYCAENEVLKRDVEFIRRNTMERKDWNESKEADRLKKIEVLKKQLEVQTEKTETLRTKREDQELTLNNIMEKIQDIFQMLDCSLEPFQNLLGDKQPSLNTLKLSLPLITEKIKDCVQIVFYRERVLKCRDKTTSRLKRYTVHAELPDSFTPRAITELVAADPCPSCIESRWMSRVCEVPETAFTHTEALSALRSLTRDPAYVRSDRVHALAECRATASRALLATRHTNLLQ